MSNEARATPALAGLRDEVYPRCWICSRTLTVGTNGDGKVAWDCAPCRKEIEALQSEVRRLKPVKLVGRPSTRASVPVVKPRAGGRAGGRAESAQLSRMVVEAWRRVPQPRMSEVAAQVGRTTERVRQILVAAGVWKVTRRGPRRGKGR